MFAQLHRRFLAIAFVFALSACTAADARGPDPVADSAAFITRLGSDTLVVERFVTYPERIEAEVLIRTPKTQLRRYVLEREPDGSMRRMEAVTFAGEGRDGDPMRRDVITFGQDSLTVSVTQDGETEERRVPGHRGVFPFLDMIHWPFDAVLRQMADGDVDSMTVDMFVGRRTAPFVVRRFGPASASITHPTRGTMEVSTDRYGRLQALDAGATTRKLLVERQTWIDLDPLLDRYVAMDAEGKSFGALSGRGGAEVRIGESRISVDYGQPSKRGREIWGALVPYGEVWRTGANRATHLETSRDLVIGGLDVPAGTYTLYTIPGPDETVLIVNRMTEQGGTTYEESEDLGRVTLAHREVSEAVEHFTIEIIPMGDGGELVLRWDTRELFVPIQVR